ncbi:MAG TPA: hypothetical protein VFD73_21315 [Gemmatimonadales bacterium]|nr:hypothetical protein [Gemmatimonadales bacterium]
MRTAPTLGLLALTGLALTGLALVGQARAEDSMATTTIRNGHSVSSVTQSGDPAKVTRHVEKRPGYTRIEQHSGGNHSVVVQSTNPADMPKMPELGKLQTDIERMLREHGLDDD